MAKLELRIDHDSPDEAELWLPVREEEPLAAAPMRMLRGPDWAHTAGPAALRRHLNAAEWYIECQMHGREMFGQAIEIDPDRRGGVPVLRNTGFTIAQLLAELAETSAVDEIARRFGLDSNVIRNALDGLSLLFQRPYRI